MNDEPATADPVVSRFYRMNNSTVLFLGGAKRVGLGERFLESGAAMGRDVSLVSYELDEICPIMKIATVIKGRRWADPDLLGHLKQLIAERMITVVLPFVDPAISVASQLRDSGVGAFVPVSSQRLCELFFDKIQADDWFRAHGVPVPPREPRPPLIAKPRYGSASSGLIRLMTKEDCLAHSNVTSGGDYLVQSLIEGDEYTADCYVDQRGCLIACVPRLRIETIAGEVVKTQTVRDPEIASLCRRIVACEQFRGPVTIQFIRQRQTGRLFVIEINPRFGGGVVASIEAGVPFCAFVLRESMGQTLEPHETWEEGLIMLRYFKEHYVHASRH